MAGWIELMTSTPEDKAGRRMPGYEQALTWMLSRAHNSFLGPGASGAGSPVNRGLTAVAARSLVARTLALRLLDLEARIVELEAAMAEVLQDDAQGPRLQQIPGIGPTGAATIRAELGESARFQRMDEVVAYAGLDPRTRQSGAFVGQKRLSKRGPGTLRHTLYLAAVVAPRCAPDWRVRCKRLLARGRAKREAHTILARALLRVIYHLLVTGKAHDPARLNPLPAPAGD
jgi:transposase